MANYKYTFSLIDVDQVYQKDSLSQKDSNLIDTFEINSSYNQSNDLLEVHYYSLDGRLLDSNYSSINIQSNQDSETANQGTLDTLTLRVDEDLLQKEYTYGDVYLVYNFLNNPYTLKDTKDPFFIEEISTDRLEVRLLSNNLTDSDIITITEDIKSKLDSPDTSEYYLNLGDNNLLIITNIDILPYNDTQSVVVRLYNPLSDQVTIKTTLNISQKVSDTTAYQAFAELISDEIKPLYLKGPNFSLNIEEDSEQPTEYFNISDLFGYPVTSSYYEVKSAFEEKGAQLSIKYNDYSNFINFSSAQERLENFKYKLDTIFDLQSQLESKTTYTSSSQAYSGSRDYYEGLINGILGNFDHYDRFLYYESSSYAWPKTGTKKPFDLVTGSAATGSGSWYELQLASASVFDSSNPHSLINTVPEFLREDPDNQKYVKFIHMIGQHFDNLWLYTKAVSDKYDGDNRLDSGVSKDLIQDALKNFGVKLYSSNKTTQELFKIFTGDFYQMTSEEFGDRLPSASFITGSSQPTSEEDYRKEIYKRLYHNLPFLTKTKGTERGLRALLSSFGVPSLYSDGSTLNTGSLFINQIGGTISGSFNLGGDQYVTSSLDRIRIDNTGSIISGGVLSQYTTINKSDSKYAKDYNLVEVGYSPANYLNNLIIASASLEGFDIDDIIGDPRYNDSGSYDQLIKKANQYLSSLGGSTYDLRDFVRTLKFYDNVLFKTVTDFLPARSNVSTGIIIKPHLLERSKTKQVQVKSSDREYLSGSYLKTSTSNFSRLKKQLVGDLTITGSIDIGETSGSHGSVYEIGGGEKDTAYSSSAMTPYGPALLNYHTRNEAKYDGELSGSQITLSTGELNDENPFKYRNPNTSFFKVSIVTNCSGSVEASNINTPSDQERCEGVVTVQDPSIEDPELNCFDAVVSVTDRNFALPTPTPTLTPTPTPTNTPTPTPVPGDTSTPTPTPTPATTSCREMDSIGYNYTYDPSSGITACTSGTPVTVYTTTAGLPDVGVVLYTDTTGCTAVNQGFYSDGSVFFTVDQFGEITASTNCVTPTPEPPTVYEVGDRTDTGAPFAVSACSDTCDTPLYASVSDFSSIGVGTVIYSNIGGTVLSGGDLWFGITATTGAPTKAIQINNSGVVTDDSICEISTPTSTPTATPTPTPSPTPVPLYGFTACDGGTTVYKTLPSEPSTSQRFVDFGVFPEEYYRYNNLGVVFGLTPVNNNLQAVSPTATGCPTTPTPAPPTPTPTPTSGCVTVSLRYSSVDSATACNASSNTYYGNGSTLFGTSVLYTDAGCTSNAPAGWYSDGVNARFWNGSSFTSTASC